MFQLTKPLILASNSPRRQQLMRDTGFEFEIKVKDTNEDFPETMPSEEVPAYLARKKAEAFRAEMENQIILTADTIVVVNDEILNKPKDTIEATEMLRKLSGKQLTKATRCRGRRSAAEQHLHPAHHVARLQADQLFDP